MKIQRNSTRVRNRAAEAHQIDAPRAVKRAGIVDGVFLSADIR